MGTDAPLCAARLIAAVDAAGPRLLALPATAVTQALAPGKWSAAEIVGHLIDSASNNHQRFVRARDQNDLVFDGYAQDAWVEWQQYASAPWDELVLLWQGYNRHLARVMRATPVDVRERQHTRHNLHRIAFRAIPADVPATLEYFMNDYVDHLEHHLAQIFG